MAITHQHMITRLKPRIYCIYEKTRGGAYITTINICNKLRDYRNTWLVTHVLNPRPDVSSGRLQLWRSLILLIMYYLRLSSWVFKKKRRPGCVYTPSVLIAFVTHFMPFFFQSTLLIHFHNFIFGEDDKLLWEYILIISKRNPLRFIYFAPLLTIFYWIEYLSFIWASKIIAPTSYSKLLIIHRYPSINGNKIVVIPNGIDREYFYPLHAYPDTTKHQILYVGRFTEEKGVRELLKAFTILNPNKYTLTIVSPEFTDGQLSELLKKISRDPLNILTVRNPTIEFIAKQYRKSDLCILPSSGSFEQMPLVYLESLACGVPVLISNKIKGVMDIQHIISRDLILPNTSPGTIAEYIDHYCSLTDNQKIIIKKRCLTAAESFSWTYTSASITALFSLLKRN